MRTLLLILLLLMISVVCANAGIITENALSNADVNTAFTAWLTDIGIAESQVQYTVDFETGFTAGQNISGQTGLLPGGLVITDTGSADSAKVQSSGQFGGSNPVGTYALSQNEQAYLELDFSAQPVDYVSFQDIDTAGTSVIVHFTDASSVSDTLDTTGTSGDSAEFYGVFRNDMPKITLVQLDASGDGSWGIDNIRYGVVPEPSGIVVLLGGIGTITGIVIRRKHS